VKRFLLLLFSVYLLYPAHAAGFGTHQLNLPTGDIIITGPELYIYHRFYGPIDNQALKTNFGTDLGANVNVGFGLPLNDQIEVSLFRSVLDSSYQIATKFKFSEKSALFLAGVEKTANGVTRNIANGIIGSTFAFPIRALTLGIAPSIVIADTTAYTVGLTVNLPIKENLESIIEYVPLLGNQNNRYPVFSAGIKYQIAVHYFTLMLTNTDYFTWNEVIRGSIDNIMHLGFNIVVMF